MSFRLQIRLRDDEDVVNLLTKFINAFRIGDLMGLREDVKAVLAAEAAQGQQLAELKTAVDAVFNVVDAKLSEAEALVAAQAATIAELQAAEVDQADLDALKASTDQQTAALAEIRSAVDSHLPLPTPTEPVVGEVAGPAGAQSITGSGESDR
jgi:hypothetical protein